MRILLLTFYYPPDLSAGSFRAAALVEALREEGPPDLHIDVLTTMPNRYHSMDWGAEVSEDNEGVSIRRYELPSHRSGMKDQARAFLSYAKQVSKATRHKQWDAVVATSSRLMTAALGARVAKGLNAPLYLDIRDLFTDTMADVLAGSPLKALLPGFRWVEHSTFQAANRLNVVSAGFLPHLRQVAGERDYRTFTNGIDSEFLGLDFDSERTEGRSEPLILYAGNIGEGQGLHEVIPEAARRLEGRARFRIIGDGGRRPVLEERLAQNGVSNVELLPPVQRSELMAHYREADILFLHLNDHAAFRKVLPSKVFEYAATGKPVLAGVGGFAAEFIEREIPGVAVFSPCSAEGLVDGFERLEGLSSPVERAEFKTKYAREAIMREMARDILEMVG